MQAIANNHHFTPPRSFLGNVWDKIKAVAKRIFDFLFSWRQKAPVFTSKQRDSIHHAIEVPAPPALKRISSKELEPPVIENKLFKKHPSSEDPTIKKFNNFLNAFFPLLINDCFQNEVVKPTIPKLIESSSTIAESIEPWAKASTIIIETLDPFIQKIDAMAKIPEIIGYTKELVHLLTKKSGADTKHIPIEWINDADDLFLKAKDTNQLITLFMDALAFFKTFTRLLESGKLHPQIEGIQNAISENLELGFEKLLEANSPKLIKVFSETVDELIFHLPYSKTFDKLMNEMHRHIDIWNTANERMNAEKLIIEKAKLVVENPNSIQSDSELSNSYLNKVESDGGEESFLNKHFIEQYKEVYKERFIERKKKKAQFSPERLDIFGEGSPEQIRAGIYNNFAVSLYKLILPSKKIKLPLDTSVKLNGLINLWESTELNEPFLEIITRVENIIHSVIEEGGLKNPEIFQTYLNVLVKKFLLEQAHQKVKSVIATGIRNIFYKLTEPDELEEVFADQLFPAITNQLTLSFTRTLLLRHITQMAPLFEDFIENPTKKKRETILSTLFELIQSNTQHYDLSGEREKFNSLTNPLITELSENLIDHLKKNSPEKNVTLEDVEKGIHSYFESEKVEVNPEYGEMVMKLLFRMGSFGGGIKEWIFSFMKGTIAEGVTLSLKDTRKSYHQVLNSVTHSMQANFLDPENIRKAFFSPQRSEEESQLNRDRVREKLPAQVHTIAALIHDILYENLYANSTYFKPYHLGTPSVETLEATITNVFKNLFKRDTLNQNLLFQGFHILNKALHKSAANRDLQKKLHAL